MIKKGLILGVFALLVAASTGCPPAGRYASCDNDGQCPTLDGGVKLICYNLRCVECRYDDNCPAGSVCSGKNTCESLDHREKEAEPAPPPTSLEECAKRCAKGNDACASSCREQFK